MANFLARVGEALGYPNLDRNAGTIFVTDQSGVVGHRVAARLLNSGFPEVRVGSGAVESLEDTGKLGAEIVDFRWDREETYEPALKGVKSVLLAMPYELNWYIHFPTFLKACKKAHVKHIVKLSFYHAGVKGDIFHHVPLVKHHTDCDQILINQVKPDEETHPNVSYTILYASHLMADPFIFQGKELFATNESASLHGASQNRGVNFVSPNDVAEVIVRVLLAPHDHYDKEYTLTGPGPITDAEIADLLSKHLKKTVTYVDQTLDKFASVMTLCGDEKWVVADLVALEKIKASGTEENHSFVSKDVEGICGHSPESFEVYLTMTDTMTPVEVGDPSDGKKAAAE